MTEPLNILSPVLVALCFLFNAVIAANPAFDVFANPLGGGGNVTVAVNVPSNSSDDLYFHFVGPATRQWIGFGFGDGMVDALMFIAYTAEDGHGITLSPRIATSHTLPDFVDSVNVTLLNGTGISDGVYTINAHCTGCRKWSQGEVNTASNNQPMIFAVGPSDNTFQSNDIKTAGISRHSLGQGSYGTYSLDMKKATGEAGVPVLTSNMYNAGDSGRGVDNDGTEEAAETHEFPIAVHAFFMVVTFLFVFPGGYLFLRVFDKVMLHAGIQTLGLVGVLAGLGAGIAYNVQTKRAISYHQVLGIITIFLTFSAFTLGLIGHRAFKARGAVSPLMKFHRIAGPASIVFGWGTAMSGFAFRGVPRRIVPFVVALLGVIIVVTGVTLMMKKRKMRKAALVTPAAQNFNEAYYAQGQGPGAPPAYGQAAGYYAPPAETVHMQTFNPNQSHDPNLNKAPGVTVYEPPPGRP